MDQLEQAALLAEAEAFFFKAMLRGYASNARPMASINMHGYKEHVWSEGDFKLLDRWCTRSESPCSSGHTTIWYKKEVVWTMNYGGYYDEEVIPVLRAALKYSYGTREFVGGRGPSSFPLNGFVYENRPNEVCNTFADFRGYEQIYIPMAGAKSGFKGCHRYNGLSLLGPAN